MNFQKTTIREVMNPEPTTIHAGAPLSEAATCMFEQDRSCLVVCLDDPAQGWGILTQKDLLGVMADVGAHLEGLRVAEVMTHPSVTLPPHYDVGTSIQLMRMLGVRRAAVVEGDELIGFVSFTDLFEYAMETRDQAVTRD